MKTIKIILLMLALMVSGLAAGVPVQVAIDSNIDSVNAARALMLHPVSYYHFDVYIQVGPGDEKSDYKTLEGTMLPDGSITRLLVDRVVVMDEGDVPLLNLPLPKDVEIRYFSAYLNGNDDSGEQVSWGNFWTDSFKRGDAIVVTMYPTRMQGFVHFNPPIGVDVNNLRIDIEGAWGWDYNKLFGGFLVFIDPSRYGSKYTITNTSTGAVLARGVVVPFEQPSIGQDTPTSSPFTVVYGNGVMDASPRERGYNNFTDQTLDGQVVNQDGTVTPAKVYFVDTEKEEYLDVSIYGVIGQAQVFEVTEYGEMPIIHKETSVPQNGNGVHVIGFDIRGYSKVIIKVTGTIDPGAGKKGFSGYFSRGFRG